MPSSPLRNIATLAQFAVQAGPMLYRRIQEDRKRPVRSAPAQPAPAAWKRSGISAAWIGHSTVLLSLDGFTILTDPVLSTRIGVKIGPWTVGMKRLVEPALALPQLPRPDLILLSHAHMDHLDRPTLRALERSSTHVVTAPGTSDLLRVRGYAAVDELAWDQSVRVGPATIRAFEVKHWGARTRTDVHRGYNGYVIEAGRHRVLFAGDTAYTPLFRKLRSSRPYDLAIMPVGAYDPWIHAHCNPEQALAMANDAGADRILPVHHRTFVLSQEPYQEPLERILEAAGEDRIALREIGQEFHTSPAAPAPDPAAAPARS